MAILRGLGRDETLSLCETLWDLGVELIEIPIQSRAAIETLSSASQLATRRGASVGAGTVTDRELVHAAADAGAAFTVAPGWDATVAAESAARGMDHLPGVATGTEIMQAMNAGLSWLKMFPAAVLGTGWLPAMRAPFPGALFVATGGIDLSNTAAFIDAGAAAVSLGGVLADPSRRGELPGLLESLRR